MSEPSRRARRGTSGRRDSRDVQLQPFKPQSREPIRAQAETLSFKKDSCTLCHPSNGYAQETSIEPDDYTEVSALNGALPASDETFPKGAPLTDHVKVGNRLLKRKPG
jgi:hypothetical protein